MKRFYLLSCVCLAATLISAQPFRVVGNQKIAEGWNPQFSSDATEVLYVENETDDVPASLTMQYPSDVRVANEDLQLVLYKGEERRVLTPHGADVNYVWQSLSPDGRRILFNTAHGTGICDLEGKEIVNLGNINAPVWFGNDYVVGMFDTHDGHDFTGSAIIIRSVDGKYSEMLTDMKEFGMYPAVSPENGQIAYSTLSGDVHLMQLNANAFNNPVPTADLSACKARKVKPAARPKKAALGVKREIKDVKIYINPGHGGHGSNDRGMTIYPFASGDPEGFWESNSNLHKGLFLEEFLLNLGMQVKMSRHTNNDGGGNDADVLTNWLNNGKITKAQYDDMLANGDDRALSAIVAEANAYNADFMLSIHSNAGGPSNYVLELYSGQDVNDHRTYRNPAPRQDESRAISTLIASNLVQNKITNWAPASRANGWVVGDKTFGYEIMGGWGDGYGVLRRLAVPGVISEGSMHDYIPETYRLMNMDYKKKEAWYFMKSFCEYFVGYEQPKGAIGGQVRDWYKKMEFPNIKKQQDTRDELLPILGAKVSLLKDGNVIDTYTTDSLYNGVYFFWDVEPGVYTIRAEADHYYTMEQEVTAEKNNIVYQDMLINAKRETRPVVLNYSPAPKDITDSIDVSTDIVLNFNWDMKKEETLAAFSITPEVEGVLSFENSYRTLRFHPSRMFEKGTEYTVKLDKSACHPDFNFDNTMAEDFVLKFRTKDRSNLRLLKSFPESEQTEVPLRPSFILVFDAKVKTNTVRNNMTVTDSEGKQYSVNTRSYKYNQLDEPYGYVSFELVDALEPDKDYTLVVGRDVQDAIGVYHNEDTAIPFHTTAETGDKANTLIDAMESLAFDYEAESSLLVSNASAQLNKDRKYAGTAANELRYTFADAESVATYKYTGDVLFNANGKCRLGMYVFADFSGNELQAIWDASGDIKYTPVCTLNYAGWHYEEADMSVLPEDVDYQFMGLRLIRHEGFLSKAGSIYIDNLYFDRIEITAVDQLRAGEVMVYPNPASSVIMVAGVETDAALTLFSPDGKMVRQNSGNMMPVEGVASGMYILRIESSSTTLTKSVIIR